MKSSGSSLSSFKLGDTLLVDLIIPPNIFPIHNKSKYSRVERSGKGSCVWSVEGRSPTSAALESRERSCACGWMVEGRNEADLFENVVVFCLIMARKH